MKQKKKLELTFVPLPFLKYLIERIFNVSDVSVKVEVWAVNAWWACF